MCSAPATRSQPEALGSEEIAYLRGRALRKVVGWGSALVIVILIFAGAATAAGWLILPAIVVVIVAPLLSRLIWR